MGIEAKEQATPAAAGLAFQVRKKFGVTRGKFSRLANVSERTLGEWEKADPPESSLRTIRELNRLYDGLARIIRPEAIGPWLERPNEAFGGSAPLQVIERGESGLIWETIYYLESGSPA